MAIEVKCELALLTHLRQLRQTAAASLAITRCVVNVPPLATLSVGFILSIGFHSQCQVSLVRQDPIAIRRWQPSRPSSTCAKRSRCGNNNCNLATNRARTALEKRVPAMAACWLERWILPPLKRPRLPVYPATAQGIVTYDYLDKPGRYQQGPLVCL